MIKKFFRLLITIFFTAVVAVFSFYLSRYLREILFQTGVLREEILIAGTGSMYPTFPKSEGEDDVQKAQEIVAWPKMRKYGTPISIFGWKIYSYDLSQGDIVEFENEKTKEISNKKYGEEAGFVKRIIAMPGDSIELRDGFVHLNGKILNEPYTAKPRSTYGGEFLSDCQKLTIPEKKVFVLGDNRKASLDSRYELGLVDFSDIHFVIPWSDQEEYRSTWRDTGQDTLLAHTSTLDEQQFVSLINNLREKSGVEKFSYERRLSASAKIRGQAMIEGDDFSIEATRSGVTLSQALDRSGYRNILSAEVFTRGFYEAEELMDNFLQFPETKSILISNEYQELGLSSVVGEINSCPVQVVVAHLGGYIPPSYTQEEIESWAKLIRVLEEVIPSWQALQGSDDVDQEKLQNVLSLLETRLENARKIHSRMINNEWLTKEEENLATQDKSLSEQAEKAISELLN